MDEQRLKALEAWTRTERDYLRDMGCCDEPGSSQARMTDVAALIAEVRRLRQQAILVAANGVHEEHALRNRAERAEADLAAEREKHDEAAYNDAMAAVERLIQQRDAALAERDVAFDARDAAFVRAELAERLLTEARRVLREVATVTQERGVGLPSDLVVDVRTVLAQEEK